MTNLSLKMRIAGKAAMMMVASAGLMLATGCSSENEINPNEPVQEAALKTSDYSVFASDNSRVHNYGTRSTRADGDAVDSFVMPECPSIPEAALDLNYEDDWGSKTNLNHGTPASGGTFVLKAGDTLTTGFQMEGITVYVAGKLKLTSLNSGNKDTKGGTFYVLPGGEIEFGEWVALTENVTVYNYGSLSSNTGITIGDNSKIYSAVDIDCVGEFGVNTYGELFSKKTITADKVRLNGNAIACAFIADEITFNSDWVNNELHHGTIKTSYFKAEKLTLNGGNVFMDNNGLVEVTGTLVFSGDNTRFDVNGTHAVIAAKLMNTNNLTWPATVFNAKFAYDIKEFALGGNKTYTVWDQEQNANVEKTYKFNDFSWPVSDDTKSAVVPAAGCHGKYPVDGVVPTEDEVVIELVAEIEPLDPDDEGVDHKHGNISATCITFGNATDVAYASYHLRGNSENSFYGDPTDPKKGIGQKGCIEVIKDNGDAGIELASYMISPDYDFNHLIVDNGNIITVGNHVKKGAFIGSLPADFEASTGVRSDFKVKELTTDDVLYSEEFSKEEGREDEHIKLGYTNAGDGNCVVRQGDHYLFTSYRGYGALNTDFSKVAGSFHKTNGSSKHIALGNGKMAILSHDSYDKTQSSATINVYNQEDHEFANVQNTYAAPQIIKPVDGKNVVAIDGNDVYACLSQGGFARLTDMKEFHRGENGKVPANGVAIDDQYIYLAMGSFVVVLDKETMTEVCHYHAKSLKSANYIALKNGKIYVAFGEDGVKVFKLFNKSFSE